MTRGAIRYGYFLGSLYSVPRSSPNFPCKLLKKSKKDGNMGTNDKRNILLPIGHITLLVNAGLMVESTYNDI